jgi:hypothetical protein
VNYDRSSWWKANLTNRAVVFSKRLSPENAPILGLTHCKVAEFRIVSMRLFDINLQAVREVCTPTLA